MYTKRKLQKDRAGNFSESISLDNLDLKHTDTHTQDHSTELIHESLSFMSCENSNTAVREHNLFALHCTTEVIFHPTAGNALELM